MLALAGAWVGPAPTTSVPRIAFEDALTHTALGGRGDELSSAESSSSSSRIIVASACGEGDFPAAVEPPPPPRASSARFRSSGGTVAVMATPRARESPREAVRCVQRAPAPRECYVPLIRFARAFYRSEATV
jgi:hypothetical protein